MAYGRLDIYWPDGQIEAVELDTPSVSVGRSAGCSVILDTETISRYHFSITQDSEKVTISDMDSINGTYVDGVLLKSNESRLLQGGEEIQAGHLRMIYHAVVEKGLLDTAEQDTDTQRYERPDAGFRIEVFGPEIDVPPGSHTTMELSITNITESAHHFTVELTGLPEGWARINRPTLRIQPHDTALVLISIKPIRKSTSTPGDYPVSVVVAREDMADQPIDAHLTITIQAFAGFGMALANHTISAYEPFKLHVMNHGSADLPIYVAGRSIDDKLHISIPRPQITLAPGERSIIQGEVIPTNRRWFGSTTNYAFDVLVRSQDEAAFLAAVRGHYMAASVFPGWATYALALITGLFFILLAAAAILVLTATNNPTPKILDFQIATNQIAQGDLLQVSWSVEDAETVNIIVDQSPVQTDLPAESGMAEIETGAYIGDIEVGIQAFNGDKEASQTLPLNVYELLVVEQFEVTPVQLLRNVAQTLQLRWQVSGVPGVRLLGVDSVSVDPIEAGYPPAHEMTITVIPVNNFTIFLSAEDALGETIEQPVNLDVVDPFCAITASEFPTLPLFIDGDNTFRPVDTPQNFIGAQLIPAGRDSTGEWVRGRLQTPGAETVLWPAAGLNCGDAFAVQDLRELADTVPLILPSPTPSLTPPPTATTEPTPTPTLTRVPPVTLAPTATAQSTP